MISGAADPMDFSGTARAGEELEITYSVDRGEKHTETVSADAEGKWNIG